METGARRRASGPARVCACGAAGGAAGGEGEQQPQLQPSLSRRLCLAAAGAAALGADALPASAGVIPPQQLHNRYFIVRAGESYTDVGAGTIKTNPGTKYDVQWGLTPRGQRQMENAAIVLEAMGCDGAPLVYTSNFYRANASATVLVDEGIAGYSDFRVTYRNYDPRPMGALEGRPLSAREAVWANDALDIKSRPPMAEASMAPEESAESVFDLYRTAIETYSRLERIYSGRDIIQVSHIDRTDVWQAALTGYPLEKHHDLAFEHGEVRLIDMSGFDEENPEESLKTAVAYGSKTLEKLIADGICDPA